MSLYRALARWFPSVPYKDRARVLAAMECCEPTVPVPASLGEDGVGTGQDVDPASLGVDHRPEGEAPRHPVAPSGPPACETDLFWKPDAAVAFEFSNGRLARLIDRWRES